VRLIREERGQTLVIVLALVGLVAALAYGYMALASTTNQQSTLRTAQLAEYAAADSGATYALWYGASKGVPAPGALAAPDPGDGKGAPAVTITDLRPGLSFGPLHAPTFGTTIYHSVAHALTGPGEVWLSITWSTSVAGSGDLRVLVDTTATYATLSAGTQVSMPAGATQTTSALGPWTLGPGTYYVHVENVTGGGNGQGQGQQGNTDVLLSSVDGNGPAPGHFTLSYPGMRFQAVSVRGGRTTALDAGLTRVAGAYTAAVNSWTLR
jgi:hypothetical protein